MKPHISFFETSMATENLQIAFLLYWELYQPASSTGLFYLPFLYGLHSQEQLYGAIRREERGNETKYSASYVHVCDSIEYDTSQTIQNCFHLLQFSPTSIDIANWYE